MIQRPKLNDLRKHAIGASLFRPTTLGKAVERLGFVQADPIRSPARAQDLILRHRVKNYRVGDLERQYGRLGFEEDFLYAYGFMPRSTWRLLHPRSGRKLTTTEQQVLRFLANRARIHPRELEAGFGRGRELNPWGGHSQSTTRVLHALHYHGALRVAGRENGIRVYAPVEHTHETLDPPDRLRRLVMLIASILGPLSDTSLRAAVNHLAHAAPGLEGRRSSVLNLVKSGELASHLVDGVRYVWPADRAIHARPNESVRFLAPFDPLVWDRRRFEHFWNWPYRFEAYTPPTKRQLGYYAMPMLWRDDAIGWVNISNQGGTLLIEPGFRKARPAEPSFETEFEAEAARFGVFMQRRHSPPER